MPFAFSANVRTSLGLAVQTYLQPVNASGQVITTYNGPIVPTGESWQRLTQIAQTMPAGTVDINFIVRLLTAGTQSAGYMEVDRVQGQISNVVSGWQDNTETLKTDLAGQAAATTSLGARVTQTETGLTSAGTQLTNLSASLGTAGGQNLFFNPAFSKEGSVTGVADGWEVDTAVGGTHFASLVPSWLVSTEKAQRMTVTNLNLNANYRGVRTANPAFRVKVLGGNSVVASCYVRATAGLVFKIFIQSIDANNTVIAAPSSALVVATGGTQRIVYDYPNLPSNTASIMVFFRLYGSDTVSAGFAEFTRPQFEIGTIVTGWKDNAGVLASDQAATATAVTGLTTTVNQQGANITAVGQQVTSLRASVGEASNFSASPNANWEMLNTLNGFFASVQAGNPTLVATPNFARMTGAGQFFRNAGFTVNGNLFQYMRLRFKRSGSTRTTGLLYWANEDGGLSEARVISFQIDTTTTGWQTVEIDLSGNPAWSTKSGIYAVRIDMVNTADTAAVVDMQYISIGSKMPGASAAALASTSATVTQQGQTISSQAQQITSLQSSVGSANSAIQSEAKTRADAVSAMSTRVDSAQSVAGNANANAQTAMNTAAAANGKVSSSIVNKVQITANNIHYNAGYALGLDYSGGTVQSAFVVSASSFVILNDNPGAGAVFSPFGVVNGQVFMNEAFIKNGSIDNAKIGDVLYSSNYQAGRSGWILRKDGIFEINSTIPGAGRIMLNGNGLNVYDENNVLRVQLGNLG
ncbi:phage tail tip fiber protein [Pseudomonas viridiflava]